ncbi:tripartite ATP-independent transporter DctM subunit [Natranaerovirga hydrolytica]|uniref:Tripartite ATP-independent transporter DctM subunit n=1 Tax=Natranaerovirga hydrolytica TaxID=680378 RepID=A0A4R1MKY6_9FIRM|nr:TRAP transporter large permease [Natranaerovirga hydrolytica]TCK93237.1 tripartite ATP-independent transporter DctM subunit [Natranaerovirga hydrolytica]
MGNPTLAILVLVLGFIILLILKVPISFSLALSAFASAYIMNLPLLVIVQSMVKGVDSSNLMAIPFFIVAGEIMGQGGISKRLIELSHVLVGWLRGGLAQVNILASMFFGGISGSAVADVSSIGAMLIPMMQKDGYDSDFSVGITITSACQGVLIPPSHNMIIYAMMAGSGVSIGKLFMAGLVPGVLLGLMLMLITYFIARKNNYPRGRRIEKKEALHIFIRGILPFLTVFIIIGGVVSGYFTATESAAIAVVYAFIITFFVIREIPLRQMNKIITNSLRTLSLVLALIASANAFSYMMSLLKVPAMITNALLSISDNKAIILLLIVLLLLLLGCIMDMAPLIIIMTPILLPVVTNLGMSPIHFGVVLIFSLAIGLCTPPVGSALFVGCAIGKTPIERTSKYMLPFYLIMVTTLLAITFIPTLVMFIPNMMS